MYEEAWEAYNELETQFRELKKDLTDKQVKETLTHTSHVTQNISGSSDETLKMSECVIGNKVNKVFLSNFQVCLADIEAQYQNSVQSNNNKVLEVKDSILDVYQSKKQMQVRMVSEKILALHSSF